MITKNEENLLEEVNRLTINFQDTSTPEAKQKITWYCVGMIDAIFALSDYGYIPGELAGRIENIINQR